MLMRANNRTVDENKFEVPVLGEFFEDPFPNALLTPASESLVIAIPSPEGARKVTPWTPGTSKIKHGLQEASVVRGGMPAVSCLSGEKMFHRGPLKVCQYCAI
jgi:hypothetical protein